MKPPEMHVDNLVATAASYNARILASVRASGDATMDEEAWAATMSKAETGSFDGPYELETLTKGRIVSPKFGIRQGSKVRPIDNLSASGVNAAVGLPEKLQAVESTQLTK